jgi:hypothetical protein
MTTYIWVSSFGCRVQPLYRDQVALAVPYRPSVIGDIHQLDNVERLIVRDIEVSTEDQVSGLGIAYIDIEMFSCSRPESVTTKRAKGNRPAIVLRYVCPSQRSRWYK